MSEKTEPKQNRREMCRDAARYVALGSVVLLSGGLLARDFAGAVASGCAQTGTAGRSLSAEQRLICRNCALLAECALPAAAAAKEGDSR